MHRYCWSCLYANECRQQCGRDKKQRAAGLESIRYAASAILGDNVSKKELIRAIGEIGRGE